MAEAAYEEYKYGKALSRVTPFWRIIDSRSATAKKLTFGFEFVREQREKEHLPL